MRRSAPYHLLKTLSLALAGLFFSLVLAVLPLPVPEIAAELPVVSALPVPVALAAVEPMPLVITPAIAVPEITVVSASEPIVAPSVIAVAVPVIIPVAVEAPEPVAPPPAPAPVPVKTIENAQARLRIPSIGVDAVIKEMGYTADGAMAVPNSRFDVSWFAPGTRPGEIGSAVIAGHNDWVGGAGVFEHLDRLVPGDVLTVVDAQGVTTSYVVQGTRTFDADDENSGIFDSASGAHLNLITCSGIWDPATRTYPTRLVVYTDLAVPLP